MTTTDSGMAVPDWPNTYGYNLFLYPWREWVFGPWALFLEHGHRLIGAMVGLITIGLVAVVWRTDDRRWLRWFSIAVLAMVVFQGLLGGMRVLFDERTLAMMHGCTGPLFFGLTVAMVVFTSRRWQTRERARTPATAASPVWILATVTCVVAYLQIVLGAVLRHVPVATEPMTFVLAVRFHLFIAAVLSLHVLVLVVAVFSWARHFRPLAPLAVCLAGLLIVQLMLGAGTWLVKFSAPSWLPAWIPFGTSAVQVGGWLQTHVITAHVAVGSLLFVTTLALALYSVRFMASPVRLNSATIRPMGAAV